MHSVPTHLLWGEIVLKLEHITTPEPDREPGSFASPPRAEILLGNNLDNRHRCAPNPHDGRLSAKAPNNNPIATHSHSPPVFNGQIGGFLGTMQKKSDQVLRVSIVYRYDKSVYAENVNGR